MFAMELIDLPPKLLGGMEHELTSKLYYSKLMDLSDNAEDKELILQIINDEAKHYHQLYDLYKKSSGSNPICLEPRIPEFETFGEGIKKVITYEMEISAFYRDIYVHHRNTGVMGTFLDIFTQENDHVLKMNFLYSRWIESMVLK